ncbi:MAG: fused MFS/spermidine synthase, partial [Myxococcota bacterium]
APYWIHLLRIAFPSTDAGFYPFYLAGFVAMLLVVGLPVILSGATLPLLFHHLRGQAGHLGDLAGRLYSWNTVGSLLGALLGGYALLFWLDLHHIYRLVIGAVTVAALLLSIRMQWITLRASPLLLAPVVAAVLILDPWDPVLLSSGLFHIRSEHPLSHMGARILAERRGKVVAFYQDGPTASVAVKEGPSRTGRLERSIVTNGKSDGATDRDYPTMGLAAAIPAVLADKIERAFVIGYGTGVTAGEFASLDSVREVVVAEISQGVIRAAPLFDFANRGISKNPKLRLMRSDAYRALLRSGDRFDVIASEPSNPWVTGVEMLYSREFLEAARSRLSPGGVYLQWYHVYETDDASVSLVLRTYASVFEEVAVWYGLGNDLLLLGFNDASSARDLSRIEARAKRPDIAASLRRSGVKSFPALLAHELLPLGVVHAAKLEGSIHTLYHPLLNYHAARAFFRGAVARLPFTGYGEPARIGAENSLLRRYAARFAGRLPDEVHAKLVDEVCKHRSDLCATTLAYWQLQRPDSARLRRFQDKLVRNRREPDPFDRDSLQILVALLAEKQVSGSGGISPERAARATDFFERFYFHATAFESNRLRELWKACEAPADRPDACQPGIEGAEALLTGRDPSRAVF